MDALDLIAKIKMDLSEYEDGLDEAKSKAEEGGSSIGGAFGKLASSGVKILTTSIAAASAGVAALTTAAVKSYADYEQLVGGVETLFGTQGMSLEEYANSVGQTVEEAKAAYDSLESAQSTVMDNASKAYKTAGMSANEYMEQATSTAAALVSSLGGDTQKAAEYADKAIIDMSDNANKMGTDIEAIQNAYNGFAKGNFTMLDNLKLGYGGTKEEMARLLEDAEKISGIEYDVSSYSDIVDAIHVVQDEMGITGTTAKEASETISGSLASTKSAWENLMTSLGSGEGINENIDALVESAGNLMGNLLPVVESALTGVSSLIENLVPKIVEEIPTLINEVLPSIVESGANITEAILTGISQNVGTIVSGLKDVLLTLVESVATMLPQFISTGVDILVSLADGISEAIPELLPTLSDVIVEMVQTLIDAAPKLISAGITLIKSLTDGLIQAIPQLIEQIPTLIDSIVNTLMEALPTLIEASIQMWMALVEALPTILEALAEAIPQIVDTIVTALIENMPTLIDGAIEFFMAIVDAIPEIAEALAENLDDMLMSIIETVVGNAGNLLTAAKNMFMSLVKGLGEIAVKLLADLGNLLINIGSAFIEPLKNLFSAAWDGIKEIFAPVVEFFSSAFSSAWTAIQNVFSGVKEFFLGIWDKIKSAFSAIGTKIGDAISGAVKSGINGVISMIEKIINGGISLINGAIDIINYIPGVEIGKIEKLNLPRLARGGIIDKPTFLEAGEDGREAIIPLENNTEWIKKVAKEMSNEMTQPVAISSPMQVALSDSDIDKIARKLSLTVHNTTEIDSVPIKEETYTYVVDRMGDETRALQLAQGGGY